MWVGQSGASRLSILTMFHIGSRIRAVREAKGYTQGFVAERLGVVQTTIGMYEKAADLKHSVILKFAQALEVNHHYLTGDDLTLEAMGEIAAVKHESQRLFLAELPGMPDDERQQFERVRLHPLAPRTVIDWHRLRDLIYRFLGRNPDTPIAAPDDSARQERPSMSPGAKKPMARMEASSIASRVRRIV